MLLLLAAAMTSAVAQGPAGARHEVRLEADRVQGVPGGDTEAEGDVRLESGPVRIRADRLRYRAADDVASASGRVVIERDGAVYRGPALEVRLNAFSGWFLEPEFEFTALGTRGAARRVDFSSRTRLTAADAQYTSCPRPDEGEPDWVLRADRVELDFEANEGIAEGGVLRFQGVPLLGLPRLSFPVTDARKSGWLPPTVNLDSRSGFEFSMPYYWNIAPDRDATFAPRLSTRRGLALNAEFRYLAPRFGGRIEVDALPHDRVAARSRGLLRLHHDHELPAAWTARLDGTRVTDDDWWKDFPRTTGSLTPRLLPMELRLERVDDGGPTRWSVYGGVQAWQTLQDALARIDSPYSRRPQLGAQARRPVGPLQIQFETELNQFVLPSDEVAVGRPEGWRWHGLADVAWPLQWPGGWIVPRLAFNSAHYRTDEPMLGGTRKASRTIPTASIDAGLVFEREASLFGQRALLQTLEPRVLYVRTPYRRQDDLPNFDAFARDFNLESVFTPNAFAGVDRVSDAHQITAGVTSRLLDQASGAELLRMGLVQRYRLRDQRVAPERDGAPDGPPLEQRLSDALLLGSTTLVPDWRLDASLQYNPDSRRLQRSIVGATWSPGAFRTLNARYRLARGLSEQMELGWQWPVYRGAPASGASCSGTWYSVGRLNYSLRDSRLTDSLLGLEYDAGCWIARVVAERVSTGQTEATTRLLLQLELVGLSRLGSNPLKVLKDNIPGYRLLRDERGEPTPP